MDREGINRKCFNKKENNEKIYIEKWWEDGHSFVPMNQKLKQELFWLQTRISEIDSGLYWRPGLVYQ